MIVQEMAQDVYTVIGKRLIRGVLLPGAPNFVALLANNLNSKVRFCNQIADSAVKFFVLG